MNNINTMMLQMQAIVGDQHGVALRLSEYTGKGYIEAPIEISDRSILSGGAAHRDTPDEAVRAYYEYLKQADGIEKRIVTNAWSDNRKEFRWNGASFVECVPWTVMD
jgi:hypothetical protein